MAAEARVGQPESRPAMRAARLAMFGAIGDVSSFPAVPALTRGRTERIALVPDLSFRFRGLHSHISQQGSTPTETRLGSRSHTAALAALSRPVEGATRPKLPAKDTRVSRPIDFRRRSLPVG